MKTEEEDENEDDIRMEDHGIHGTRGKKMGGLLHFLRVFSVFRGPEMQ